MIDEEIPQAVGSEFGHNSGNMLEQARADLRASLYDDDSKGKTFAQRKSEFLTSASKQTVRDRETAGAAGDTIKLAAEVWAMIDATRREQSDPFRAVHLALSREAAEFWEPVNDSMLGLLDQINVWTADEDKRIEDQRAEQAAEMAKMRAASVPAPTPPPAPAITGRKHIDYAAPDVRPTPSPAAALMRPTKKARIIGDLGAVVSKRDVVSYEIEDFSLLPDHILKSPTVVEAILTVARATARHMGVPAGIRVNINTTNQVR